MDDLLKDLSGAAQSQSGQAGGPLGELLGSLTGGAGLGSILGAAGAGGTGGVAGLGGTANPAGRSPPGITTGPCPGTVAPAPLAISSAITSVVRLPSSVFRLAG